MKSSETSLRILYLGIPCGILKLYLCILGLLQELLLRFPQDLFARTNSMNTVTKLTCYSKSKIFENQSKVFLTAIFFSLHLPRHKSNIQLSSQLPTFYTYLLAHNDWTWEQITPDYPPKPTSAHITPKLSSSSAKPLEINSLSTENGLLAPVHRPFLRGANFPQSPWCTSLENPWRNRPQWYVVPNRQQWCAEKR